MQARIKFGRFNTGHGPYESSGWNDDAAFATVRYIVAFWFATGVEDDEDAAGGSATDDADDDDEDEASGGKLNKCDNPRN